VASRGEAALADCARAVRGRHLGGHPLGGSVNAADFFAGAGGSSTGAVAAGATVVAAINHWPRAVETHAANHPSTLHRCQDIALMDPRDLPAFDLGLFSPSCTGHTDARGAEAPRHDAARGTAWCVVTVAELRRPRFLVVENVPAFTRWALYPMWRASLEALGYQLRAHVVNAQDFGVPQHRERLLLTGALGRPAPVIRASLAPRHIPADETIDWSAGTWAPIEGHAPATMARIAAGRERWGRRFLVRYNGSAKDGRPVTAPWGALTTIDRFGIVDGDRMRMPTLLEYLRAFGFPDGYRLTGNRREGVKQCGNAVPPPLMEAAVRAVLEAA
jgi:DNA (cytosine-5)-methyltransferase 1